MKKSKTQKGITLLALIITIVVLLILAVVAIGAVRDSGIIMHAQDAGTKYTEAQVKEKLDLAISEAYIAGKGKISESDLRSALASQFGNDFTLTSSGENFTLEISGKQYTISSTGSIGEYEEKLERIYYTTKVGENNVWAEGYVDSEGKVPDGATITAKFYKTNTPLQPIIPEEMKATMPSVPTIAAGYAYKLVIDGEGIMPTVVDTDNGEIGAWGTELSEIFAGDLPERISGLYLYVTEAQINGKISNVGKGALAYNISLSNVTISDNVETINSYAFAFTNLSSLNIGNVKDIDPWAFNGCYELRSINLSKDYTTVKEYAFANCGIESIDLSDITEMGDAPFMSCDNLKNVEIGDNITVLGENIFEDCDALQTIDLKNVNSFGNMVFYNCRNLKTIKIKASSLTEVGNSVFKGIASGSKIYVLNQDVKDALEGKYDPNLTTIEIKTLAEMEQL